MRILILKRTSTYLYKHQEIYYVNVMDLCSSKHLCKKENSIDFSIIKIQNNLIF